MNTDNKHSQSAITNNTCVQRMYQRPPLKVRVGDCSIQCNHVKQCERLVKAAQKLSESAPITIKSDSYTIQTGSMVQTQQATDITNRLADQAPIESKFLGISMKAGTLKKFTCGALIVATIAWTGWFIKKKIDKKFSSNSNSSNSDNNIRQFRAWPGDFYCKYQMPELPPILNEIVSGAPKGYEDSMLLFLIQCFGTFCFSKVRAPYSDGKIHAPNIMVVVEGKSGSGKEKFVNVFDALFKRIIEKDLMKLAESNREDSPLYIIQHIGGKTTESKFHDILADNEEVHAFVLCEEIIELVNRGITNELMRKALGNEITSRNNKSKKDAQGIFKVFLNMFLTGTPESLAKFFPSRELEGGTNSRFIWAEIPLPGRYLETPKMPDKARLEVIRDQIDLWQQHYCYKVDKGGNDKAVDEVIVNLDYVVEALNYWLDVQWNLAGGVKDCERNTKRGRMGSIAFNCAIVLHMMFGCPDESDVETRKKVVDLTIYIANYCMERYLYKFDNAQTIQTSAQSDGGITTPAISNKTEQPIPQEEKYSGKFTKSDVIKMAKMYAPPQKGDGSIAKFFGLDSKEKKVIARALHKLQDELRSKPTDDLEDWEQTFLMYMRTRSEGQK